jgi:DNA excision repair protein ERCC-2
MQIELELRQVRMSVGDFADFTLGPRDSGEGPAGVWRAQLGTHWHRELRAQASIDYPAVDFEVPVDGPLTAGPWTVLLNGRMDQVVRNEPVTIREIKTVTRALPEGEDELRKDYPAYFIQLAAYVRLRPGARGELVFVETGTGLSQTVPLAPADERLLDAQLGRVADFLELRWRARERLRHLVFAAPFAALRPGQETVAAELAAQAGAGRGAVLLEAPTGFGKTGVLLEFALGQLRSGQFERAIYLTGKATGQIQVVRTLATMAPPHLPGGPAAWVIRPKSEHCVNHTFHCVRDDCRFLDDVEGRWETSGLSRFYRFEDHARDLPTLRAAGMAARICPYEITRAALPFNDVWIGDYNYVFAPGNRGLFFRQPGFDPARSLLLIDEAHNLPSRVADAYSHFFDGREAQEAGVILHSLLPYSALSAAWDQWTDLLLGLAPCPALDDDTAEQVKETLVGLSGLIRDTAIDYGRLTPRATEVIWEVPSLAEQFGENTLPRLWWCRRPGELLLTCLDAAVAIGAALNAFGAVVLATATPGPIDDFAASCGLETKRAQPSAPRTPEFDKLGDLTKKATKKLFRSVGSAADLLGQAQAATPAISVVRAPTPWRDHAYDIAFDVRVDTTFQHRSHHARTTALTVEMLTAKAATVVFFPSYAYAEMIQGELAALTPGLQVGLQPRGLDLAGQTAWVEATLNQASALFLVLGSSFAESIDTLGGRITQGMVVGPALPEVNAVQRARLASLAPLGRELAARRTYQIPGMQKVNQALGRLVRAPGQKARVLLHCRRFAEPAYRELLAADYRVGNQIETEQQLRQWVDSGTTS